MQKIVKYDWAAFSDSHSAVDKVAVFMLGYALDRYPANDCASPSPPDEDSSQSTAMESQPYLSTASPIALTVESAWFSGMSLTTKSVILPIQTRRTSELFMKSGIIAFLLFALDLFLDDIIS